MTEEEFEINKNNLIEKVDKACSELYPFFDSVQIFVNLHVGNDAGTFRHVIGQGNWYARYGQICEWIEENKTNERINQSE